MSISEDFFVLLHLQKKIKNFKYINYPLMSMPNPYPLNNFPSIALYTYILPLK